MSIDMRDWNVPLSYPLNGHGINYAILEALAESPGLSMLSEKALRSIAALAADAVVAHAHSLAEVVEKKA